MVFGAHNTHQSSVKQPTPQSKVAALSYTLSFSQSILSFSQYCLKKYLILDNRKVIKAKITIGRETKQIKTMQYITTIADINITGTDIIP